MKPTALLLAASLLANVALIALYATRSPAPAAPPSVAPPTAPARAPAASADELRAALASGSAADLQAAGLSPDLARELALGRSLSKIAERLRTAQNQSAANPPWWRARPVKTGSREQQLLARRELADALTATFADDLGVGGSEVTSLAFLTPEKRTALRRITQDYDEMMAKFSAGGPQLASDREQLALLRSERERDIAALLTPEERLAYDLRTSPSGATVRSRYGDAIESETEFEKIYALQKAFDEKFPREALTGRISPDVLRARSDAERQLDADLRSVVGDNRYSALRRAADTDLRTVDALVNRLNLPPATTATVAATRETLAAESQRINADTTLPFPQRRAQIQELGTRAKSDLSRTLGAEAGEAYAQNSQWMNLLQNGMAYATTPQPGSPGSLGGAAQSVFPIMPAAMSGPGGARQMFISATSSPDGGAGGERTTTTSNVQVMSFSTTSADPHSPAAATGEVTVRPVIVVPGQPPATPPAPKP